LIFFHPGKNSILTRPIFIRSDSELIRESVCAYAKLFVDEENVGCAKIESWKNKNIDGFYTKTTQKGGFSQLCVKIKKRCYTYLLHFSTCKHNLISFFRPNCILTVELHLSFLYIFFSGENTKGCSRKKYVPPRMALFFHPHHP
jgi:hypothetical protein